LTPSAGVTPLAALSASAACCTLSQICIAVR
jgi:hypothetical protein